MPADTTTDEATPGLPTDTDDAEPLGMGRVPVNGSRNVKCLSIR